jgi:FkbM family methyltransferase
MKKNTSNFTSEVINAGGSVTKIELEHKENLLFLTASIFMNCNDSVFLNLRCFDRTNNTNSNHFSILNSNFQIKEKFIVDTSKFDVLPLREYHGLEDVRLVKWHNKMYLCGNDRYDSPTSVRRRIYLSEVEIANGVISEISRYLILSPEESDNNWEKNWMPILEMPYHFVRWSNPTEIIKYDIEKNTTTVVYKKEQNTKLENLKENLRGSSQVISWKGGYLAVVHENYYTTYIDWPYKTGHRFLFWDKDWNLIKFSEEFFFFSQGIEFCAGLIYQDNQFLLSISIDERENFIIECPSSIVEEMMGFNSEIIDKICIEERSVTSSKARKKIGFDVGACIGETICNFEEFDEIYAFEPSPYAFNILSEKYKNDPRVKCFQIGISDEDSFKQFNWHDHYGYSSFLEIDKEGEFAKKCEQEDSGYDELISVIPVQTKRIDTFMKENCIEYIDFLKVDTQGSDFNVLKSLGEMIDKVDIVETEVQIKPLYKNSASKQEILNFMEQNNFNLVLEQENSFSLSEYEQKLTFKKK